ncbi:MAG: CRISPR-associated endonuclease Cas1 [Verrucomicrobiae bacterium]|nr:CRISPR-associated endonuclease Cas1 [Verrucomicrobiae bacterium]
MGNAISSTLPEDWATVDMVAQHAYCPRRFHLMYIEGRWEDNEHTEEGKDAHRRVDRIDHLLPEAKISRSRDEEEEPVPNELSGEASESDPPPEIARSVSLGCDELGLMGKLDLVSADPEGGEAVPVETKKGRVPNTPERSYPTERIQLMAQGLLLRAHGYRSDHGYLYFAGSRQRVRVEFTAELEAETRTTIAAVRIGRSATTMPPPLEDSPKCWGCSLCGICLPDETNALWSDEAAMADFSDNPPRMPEMIAGGFDDVIQPSSSSSMQDHGEAGPDVRRLFPARDRAMPFYVQEQGARIGKSGERLNVIKEGETVGGARLREVSQLVLMGNVQVSAQALHLMMEKGIPVVHFSTGGWFHGISHGIGIENAYARAAQYEAAADPQRCVRFARGLVRAKAGNQRALLMRNGSGRERDLAVSSLADALKRKHEMPDALPGLLGWEGRAAALYFSAFSSMLKTGALPDFQFCARNRRPPKDPVNALLSFAYALLAKECLVALWGEGLDPWWGLYHQARHGRPALALDVMEPFRPVIADSVVLTAINTGMVGPRDFITNGNGCAMKPNGRKAFLRAWEQRLDQLYTHPEFDYRCSWRTILRIQARLLARWLRNDIPRVPWPVVR